MKRASQAEGELKRQVDLLEQERSAIFDQIAKREAQVEMLANTIRQLNARIDQLRLARQTASERNKP